MLFANSWWVMIHLTQRKNSWVTNGLLNCATIEQSCSFQNISTPQLKSTSNTSLKPNPVASRLRPHLHPSVYSLHNYLSNRLVDNCEPFNWKCLHLHPMLWCLQPSPRSTASAVGRILLRKQGDFDLETA